MIVTISLTKRQNGRLAAVKGAELIRDAIQKRGRACIILATGASQFEMFDQLVQEDIDWDVVTVFHLDEYIGMPESHPASFRKFLKELFSEKLPQPVREFHYINAEADPEAECQRLGEIISKVEVDVAFLGIGENCHLAFNDPPADFETEDPFIVVDLDEACRRQQLGEGWFKKIEDVAKEAISMSIKQIMKSKSIVCTVPGKRKASAVKAALEGPVMPDAPASILQKHADCCLFLDRDAASILEGTY